MFDAEGTDFVNSSLPFRKAEFKIADAQPH